VEIPKMIRKSIKTWLAMLMLATSGCSSFNDYVLKTETGMRNQILSQKAWSQWSWCYDDLDHPSDFSCGFKAGYRNILEGGSGCQPTLPPRQYWKPCYETPNGRGRINAWFDGFSHGALAAQQDGMGGIGILPISPTARQNLMMKRTPRSTAEFGRPDQVPLPDQSMLPESDGALDGDRVPAGGNDPALVPEVPPSTKEKIPVSTLYDGNP
jgi:hypothetical protein